MTAINEAQRSALIAAWCRIGEGEVSLTLLAKRYCLRRHRLQALLRQWLGRQAYRQIAEAKRAHAHMLRSRLVRGPDEHGTKWPARGLNDFTPEDIAAMTVRLHARLAAAAMYGSRTRRTLLQWKAGSRQEGHRRV